MGVPAHDNIDIMPEQNDNQSNIETAAISATDTAGHIPAPGDADFVAGEPIDQFKPHWHLYIPTVIIAAMYIVGWVTLIMMGKGDGNLARLFIIVISIGVPLLGVYAFLRHQTIQIQLFDNYLSYHRGWPISAEEDLPLLILAKVEVRKGLSGRLFGGGTLVMTLLTGKKISITDLGHPNTARRKIDAARIASQFNG